METGGRTALALPTLEALPGLPSAPWWPRNGGSGWSGVPGQGSTAFGRQLGAEDTLGQAEELSGPGATA